MIENTVIMNGGKAARIAKYREHLDKMSILLEDKYDLPEISGAVKQIAWAKDIRTKFVESLDKQRNNISRDTLDAVRTHIFGETSARWWIDRKDVSFEEHILYAKTLGKVVEHRESKPVRSDASPIVVIDCTDSDKVVVSNTCPAAPAVLERFGFHRDGSVWIRDVSISANERAGLVDSLCLSLLQNGCAARVVVPPVPAPVYDGVLTVVNGRLCVEARTEAVYKAASRFGCRRVYVDKNRLDELAVFLKNYDVFVSDDAREVLNHD